MSGILKSVSKIFKKVVGVVKKVAIPALMIGAVALTGGAALGILPSLGTMVGGLGLSAGLTSALTGAISTGAMGAVGGLITGGVKGAKKGFLMGAAAGGVMGAAGITGPNGLLGGGKAAAAGASGIAPTAAPGFASAAAPGISSTLAPLTQALPGGLGSSVASGLSSAAGSFASAAAPVVSSVAPLASALPNAAAAAAGGGGGALGLLSKNPLLASQLLSGVTSAFSPSEASEAAKARAQADEQRGFYSYGGGDTNGKKKGGIMPGVYSGQADPFGLKTYAPPPSITPGNYVAPTGVRHVYNPSTNTIEEVRV